MALSNIFREPRREITETAVGLLPILVFLFLDYKFVSIGFSTRYQSYMENIDKKFNESILHDIDHGYDYYSHTYVLPGLPKYREKDKAGSWVHDFRIGFQISKSFKISYIVTANQKGKKKNKI